MNYTAIFQGGGLKTLAYIGAIIALEEEGFKCIRAAGTSAGAIFAALIMAGYSGMELKQIVKDINFNELIKKEPNGLKGILQEKGLYSLYYIEKEIANLLSKKNAYNFKLYRNNDDYMLKMTGSNISINRPLIFPNDLLYYNINPDFFPISKAVIMSCTYPGFFKPFKLNNMYIADGGIYNNFPYNAFKYKQDDVVIGLVLSNKEMKNIPNNIKVIKLNTLKTKMLNFKIDKKDQMLLIQKAYIDTKKQLRELFG